MPYHPYLSFGGNCREAFTRYQEIFGGQLDVMSAADLPDGEAPPFEDGDLVIHAALVVGDDVLLASDDPSDGFNGVAGMSVNYTTDDVGEAQRVFAALAEGGETTMEAGPTFWSPCFGMCVDRFGTPWMVNAAAPDSAA